MNKSLNRSIERIDGTLIDTTTWSKNETGVN